MMSRSETPAAILQGTPQDSAKPHFIQQHFNRGRDEGCRLVKPNELHGQGG